MTYSDSTPAVTYTYDDTTCNGLAITYGGGRRTCMTDGAGTTGWSYDPAGHILTEQRTIAGITKTTSFTYNLDGSVATKTFPSARVLTYTYNNAQRLLSIVDTANSVNYAKSGAYAPQGALASVVHGQVSGGFAGITVTKTYNNRLQLATQRATSANGTVLDLTYGYDLGGGVNNGNVVNVANNKTGATGRTQSFTYDTLNRVSSAQSQAASGTDCWGQSYGYDRYGNLLTASVTKCSAPALSLTVNGSNQITNTGFGYDAAGNMTAADGNTFAFDAENRTSSVAGVNYTYDGDGWRVKKSSNELDWYDVSSDHDLMAETDLSGNTTTEYVFMDTVLIAKRDSSGNVFYNFGDRIASNRVMTNSTGAIMRESDYYPFGVERPVVTTMDTKHKFTGKKRDTETSSGLDYSHFRMFDPNRGRWISADPVGGDLNKPQTLNRYPYVLNDPLNLIDPEGSFVLGKLCPVDACVTATVPPVATVWAYYTPTVPAARSGPDNDDGPPLLRRCGPPRLCAPKKKKTPPTNTPTMRAAPPPPSRSQILDRIDQHCRMVAAQSGYGGDVTPREDPLYGGVNRGVWHETSRGTRSINPGGESRTGGGALGAVLNILGPQITFSQCVEAEKRAVGLD